MKNRSKLNEVKGVAPGMKCKLIYQHMGCSHLCIQLFIYLATQRVQRRIITERERARERKQAILILYTQGISKTSDA